MEQGDEREGEHVQVLHELAGVRARASQGRLARLERLCGRPVPSGAWPSRIKWGVRVPLLRPKAAGQRVPS